MKMNTKFRLRKNRNLYFKVSSHHSVDQEPRECSFLKKKRINIIREILPVNEDSMYLVHENKKS